MIRLSRLKFGNKHYLYILWLVAFAAVFCVTLASAPSTLALIKNGIHTGSSIRISTTQSEYMNVRAIVLIDSRLYALLSSEVDNYVNMASQRRGFGIHLDVINNLDDWDYNVVKQHIIDKRTHEFPNLEGVLFIGNINIPSFYKSRNDSNNIRLVPRYYEDLDGVFEKHYPDDSIDPLCDDTNEPNCNVFGPTVIPPHDFDYTAKGINSAPELWVSVMPVGFNTNNSYLAYADQLRPYFNKLISYYQGKIETNGQFYRLSNDAGEQFIKNWDAWGSDKINFYGKNITGSCFANGENVCYRKWDLTQYKTAQDFLDYYHSTPWPGEGWQSGDILLQHMNQQTYAAVEVNVHSYGGYSVISSDQAATIQKGGLIVALAGCSVAEYYQPGRNSRVDSSVAVSENILVNYLYGSSKAIVALGDPFNRGHYADFPEMYYQMLRNGKYLGAAHRDQMIVQYAISENNPWGFREDGMEMVLGDPFMDLSSSGQNLSSVAVTSPNGGEQWPRDSAQNIIWTNTGNVSRVKIELVSADSSSGVFTIIPDLPNSGFYQWTIPNCTSTNSCSSSFSIPSGSYYVKVTDLATGVYDQSNTYFKIISSQQTNNSPVIVETPTDSVSNETINQPTIQPITQTATQLSQGNFDNILATLNILRNQAKELEIKNKYLKNLLAGVIIPTNDVQNILNDFITYGVDQNTKALGAGERAAVLYSYKTAYGKLPSTQAELSDVIKIANGRWPNEKNTNTEDRAKVTFQKIYRRIPNTNNSHDNAAVVIMAYGLRQSPQNRNLNSERAGMAIFQKIFGHVPQTTEGWNAMQAITYSGAIR